MRSRATGPALLAALTLGACVENTAPGNDREAALASTPAAPTASAGQALSGVDVATLHPQIMTEADLAAVPGGAGTCRFRFTRVGFPVFLYAATPGGEGTIKLNGKLVQLPSAAAGRYEDGGVQVTVRPVEERTAGELFEAEMVLRLRGLPYELGYRGFARCGAG